jgi:quercetin dioxygenase-like cupin family protein
MNKLFLMLVAAMLSAGTVANAQSLAKTHHESNHRPTTTVTPKAADKTPLMVSFDELKWVVLPENKGMQFAALIGDHTKGPYTQMRRVKAGTDHGMHVHSVEITDVVISGLWYAGADMASAKNFGPGSVIVIPAGWVHVSGCRPGSDCVFYHEGKGKFDFKPVRPKILDRKSGN